MGNGFGRLLDNSKHETSIAAETRANRTYDLGVVDAVYKPEACTTETSIIAGEQVQKQREQMIAAAHP